jgi:type IV secretory pathway protease TraF
VHTCTGGGDPPSGVSGRVPRAVATMQGVRSLITYSKLFFPSPKDTSSVEERYF